MGEFIKRTITGIVLVLLTIGLTLLGGKLLATFVFLLSLIGIREFYKVADNIFPSIRPVGYLVCILFYLESTLDFSLTFNFIMAFTIISSFILFVFRKDIQLTGINITILSIIYIPFLFQHIIYLEGSIYIWLVFITAWGTDTFAYLAGNLFGKNKLCPKLSPNKTVEGAIGGVLGSVILTTIFVTVFKLPFLWKFVLLSILAAILAQIGDLTASKIKRVADKKDYGFIMPGHGGVLDRFDSILFTAPCVYYFVKFFI